MKLKLGDVISTVTTPITKAVDKFFGTDLQNCPGCKQMKQDLNAGMSFLDATIKRMKEIKQQ